MLLTTLRFLRIKTCERTGVVIVGRYEGLVYNLQTDHPEESIQHSETIFILGMEAALANTVPSGN
jgi:hypothetical protein